MISRTLSNSNRIVLGALLLSLFPALQAQASTNSSGNKTPTAEVSTTSETNDVAKDPYDRQYGAVLGIQFPTGPILELNYRSSRNFSFGISGGGLSLGNLGIDQGTQQSGVQNTISTLAFETKARWHVMNRAFFLGLAAGWFSLKISGIDGNHLNTGSIHRFYLTPHLGWMWVMNSGFTIGTEFGLQVPFGSPNTSQTGLSPNSAKFVSDVSRVVLPYLTLIKLGYSF